MRMEVLRSRFDELLECHGMLQQRASGFEVLLFQVQDGTRFP